VAEFRVEIRTAGAAFSGDDGPYEVARILRDIADQVEVTGTLRRFDPVSVLDINGNVTGFYRHK
jgi:hypothetical protein